MSTLIACLSTGKGTWVEVIKVIKSQNWDRVFLITNQFGKDNFRAENNTQLIVIDENKEVFNLINDIKKELGGKISDFEVALNIVSGSGKEHVALLEAVLELGLSFRLVTLKNNKLKIMGLNLNS